MSVTVEDIVAARDRIAGGVQETPCTHSILLSELCGAEIFCKLEYQHRTGSFKERGARNALMLLPPEQKKRGAISASAGNHALGMAYHGGLLGIPVTVVMPRFAPLIKVANSRKLGATVVLHGDNLAEARTHADAIAAERELTYIHGYNDAEIIAGQGTIALEILEQLQDVDAIVVSIGGGGLIAGIACAVKSLRPSIRVFGVEPENAACYTAALAAGKPADTQVWPTLADGLAVACIGARSFATARDLVEKVVTVNESSLATAILRLIELDKMVIEGAGAAPLAALLAGKLPELRGKRVVLVVSGGNIDLNMLDRVHRGRSGARRAPLPLHRRDHRPARRTCGSRWVNRFDWREHQGDRARPRLLRSRHVGGACRVHGRDGRCGTPRPIAVGFARGGRPAAFYPFLAKSDARTRRPARGGTAGAAAPSDLTVERGEIAVMIAKRGDMTPVMDLTLGLGTGPVRGRRPVYVDLLPPCNHACPAGENIQAWLALAQAGKYRQAWETLVQDNPLPGVHGRVCYHPCEDGCNRKDLDEAVSIHAVERFLGDLAIAEGWSYPRGAAQSGKRILVVGAGPSGLSAAYHLTRLGHAVEIHEAGPVPGGMLHFGIPAYRLPRADLMREIQNIEAMGVRIVLDHKVDDVLAKQRSGAFDAVFIAIGAHIGKHADIPARDAARVLDAVTLLRDTGAGEAPLLGRRVIVYGGGNTAMDAARTARRLGADEALIVYRRDRAHMPAHGFEADEALAEGIKIKWLTTIKEVVGPDLTVEQMELDANGRPQPTGRLETLHADAIVLALGQETESGFLRDVPG